MASSGSPPSCSPSTINTRQSKTIFGLGPSVTKDDAIITGCRLPTNRQVLRCMLYYTTIPDDTNQNKSKWSAAKIVLAQLMIFYQKANIPVISEIKCCERLVNLLEENAKIRAIPKDRRTSQATLNKLQEMEKKLGETFQLWPANAENVIKNPEDLAFLLSMKGNRSASFGAQDKVTANKLKRRHSRQQLAEERQNKEKMRKEEAGRVRNPDDHLDSSSDATDSESEDSESGTPEHLPSSQKSHHRRVRIGTPAFIPHDILKRPKLVSLATRLNMTAAQQASFTSAIIEEAQGSCSKISYSYATADRSRRQVVRQLAEDYKEHWIAPQLATLHWDSKLMTSLIDKNISVERLCVIVGNSQALKLLGTPFYPTDGDESTGQKVADLTVQLLRSWHCTEAIVNMTFDTTASNTGHVSAACISIQQELNKALLWSGCRHHIGEVIISHVFDDLKIEASKSPDVSLFTRFRKQFNPLNIAYERNSLKRLDLSNYSDTGRLLLSQFSCDVLQLCRSELELRRDDYKEFVELCTIFLDTTVTDVQVSFKRPGALHKARWMAKLLYSIKICLLEEQIQGLPRGSITAPHQVKKIREFVIFVTTIYSTWWMTCASVADAPWNDLQLVYKLIRYDEVNEHISASALRAFRRHFWYLTAEMVPLALFSDKVPDEIRRSMADKLLELKPEAEMSRPLQRFGTGFGKPKFPEDINLNTSLVDLLSPDSWFIFHVLKLQPDFLTKDVQDWSKMDSYKASLDNLQAINIVNDGAERGIKLSNDFLSAAKGEKQYQSVLQVVECDRKQRPDLRKNKAT